MELKATDTFVVRQKCERCDGEGRVAQLWCEKCGSIWTPATEFTGRKLPCGHTTIYLKQRTFHCGSCDGMGYTVHTIPISDLVEYLKEALELGPNSEAEGEPASITVIAQNIIDWVALTRDLSKGTDVMDQEVAKYVETYKVSESALRQEIHRILHGAISRTVLPESNS